MIPYLLGIVTGILLSILNLYVLRYDYPKKAGKLYRDTFINKKAHVVDMTPPVDLGTNEE